MISVRSGNNTYSEQVDTSIRSQVDTNMYASNNRAELKQHVSKLLVSLLEIMLKEKDMIDISYEDVKDRIFKLREKEKNMVTDRLKNLTDEERDADTVLKIHKLNQYNKGLQKGLTVLDADYYDNELELRDEMLKAEKAIRTKKGVTDDNMDLFLDDYQDELQTSNAIEREELSLQGLQGNDDDDYYGDDYDNEEDDYGNYENENDD